MNNLLQSLASQRLKVCAPDTDLKRLLATVKEGRSHDAKVADAFYDSLEGVLVDLRTVTIDNHDADAFLKPVSKVDYPDYYEIITTPMDFQTMLRKVKQKQYKSKHEFTDDLDLMWSNCFMYNTGDEHPLRLCAKRLKAKAERLLKNITDRRDRVDPSVPFTVGSILTNLPKPNGNMANGHSRSHSRQHSTPPVIPALSSLKKSTPPTVASVKQETATPSPAKPIPAQPQRDVPFLDMPAFIRTPSGMSAFMELDAQLDSLPPFTSPVASSSNQQLDQALTERLRTLAGLEPESEDEGYELDSAVNGEIGEKRKVVTNGIQRPRKRARLTSRGSGRSAAQDPVEVWWDATRSCSLMANAVPMLTYSSSNHSRHPLESSTKSLTQKSPRKKGKRLKQQTSFSRHGVIRGSGKAKGKAKVKQEEQHQQSKTLLGHMNNNIRTMKRVRRTHDKFLALNLAANTTSDDPTNPPAAGPAFGSVEPPELILSSTAAEDDEIDVQVDDRPWKVRGAGLEMGEAEAEGCLEWMGGKLLEHAGFQGTSKAALDVFTGVTAEYLYNVGRTMRFMCDKYSRTMTPEEIILHTLFESGITHIRDLERYIKDDVIRYGGRLVDLEKKLVSAYRDVTAQTSADAMDDEALFGEEEDEEEDGAFVMGGFADAFGEDFLGLRELGIAGEHGLASLTVPKKLLKGKNKGVLGNPQDSAKPKEPPPPYPPPPLFVPLDSLKVDDQIGLLKPFYMQRISAVAPPLPVDNPAILTHSTLGGPQLYPPPASMLMSQQFPPPSYQLSAPTLPSPMPGLLPAMQPKPQPLIILPDDPPNPARTKIGPLGQILKTGAAAKKKAKANLKDANAPTLTVHSTSVDGGVMMGQIKSANDGEQSAGASGSALSFGDQGTSNAPADAAKKKKNLGAGKKKKDNPKADMVPPAIIASA